jgi:hypothetical protein
MLVWCSSKFIVVVDELFLPNDPFILYNQVRKYFCCKCQHYIPTHVCNLSKSIIFATIDATIIHGTMWVKLKYCIYDYKTAFNCICNYDLWSIVNLDANEDEKCSHVIQWLMASNNKWKYICITTKCVLVCQVISLNFEWIHWSQWLRLGGDVVNSLVHWTWISQLHLHFLIVLFCN